MRGYGGVRGMALWITYTLLKFTVMLVPLKKRCFDASLFIALQSGNSYFEVIKCCVRIELI